MKLEIDISDDAFELLKLIKKRKYVEYRDNYTDLNEFKKSKDFLSGRFTEKWFLDRNVNGTLYLIPELIKYNLVEEEIESWNLTYKISDIGESLLSTYTQRNNKIDEILNEEYIICAAYWFKDFKSPYHNARNLDKGLVLCGWRHANIVGQHNVLLNKRQSEMGELESGFMTSEGNFVDRKEAAKIAFHCGQIKEEKKELYSEDIY